MHGLVARQWLSIRIEEQFGRCAGGRGLAAVIARKRLCGCVPIEHEGASADAGGLRLDQGQDHLRGDARVDRRAAFAQHLEPRLGRKRMGRDDHVLLGFDERLRRQAAFAFGHVESERGAG